MERKETHWNKWKTFLNEGEETSPSAAELYAAGELEFIDEEYVGMEIWGTEDGRRFNVPTETTRFFEEAWEISSDD